MSRVSKKHLDRDIESEMFKQFWASLGKIKNSETASQFFSDLLTETEKTMLAKRFTAAILLIRNKSATEIKESLHIAYSTIGSVASWVKNAKPKTIEILTALSQEKDWEKIIDRIDLLLDKLPPVYGTDWQEAGKEKWKRTKKRSARSLLR